MEKQADKSGRVFFFFFLSETDPASIFIRLLSVSSCFSALLSLAALLPSHRDTGEE